MTLKNWMQQNNLTPLDIGRKVMEHGEVFSHQVEDVLGIPRDHKTDYISNKDIVGTLTTAGFYVYEGKGSFGIATHIKGGWEKPVKEPTQLPPPSRRTQVSSIKQGKLHI